MMPYAAVIKKGEKTCSSREEQGVDFIPPYLLWPHMPC